MTNNGGNVDIEKMIENAARERWYSEDFTTKLTEQGMQTASVIYPIGFKTGAKWMLEHMKQKEMEKLADETLDDRYAKLHTENG